jgi:hypothetical protein
VVDDLKCFGELEAVIGRMLKLKIHDSDERELVGGHIQMTGSFSMAAGIQ